MSDTETLLSVYEKLNVENQSYALSILQALNYAQDALIKRLTVSTVNKSKSLKNNQKKLLNN